MPRERTLLLLTLGTLVILLLSQNIAAQPPKGANWIYPGYDLRNTNFSPQEQINKDNVNLLELRWIYQVPENPFRIPALSPLTGIETTPLVVNGIVYFATPYNRVIALRADTGHVIWEYQVNMSKFVEKEWWAYVANQKNLVYHDGVIYMMASDCTVYGFDALTGEIVLELPGERVCDIPGNSGFYWGENAPLVYDNLLIVRASTAIFGGRGFIAAYDKDSLELVWRWYSIPPVGGDPEWDFKYVVERGGRLFSGPARGNIKPYPGDWGDNDLMGGGAAWGRIAIDEERGILYATIGQPSVVYDAALRPGPNLYTMSIVALDARTGDMLWYYQTVPHPLVAIEPGWSAILADITIDGQERRVVIAASKNDYIYVLDAETGEPVYEPIKIGGPELNMYNVNKGNEADMTLSTAILDGKTYCPGAQGGVESIPALAGNILYVATQRACHIITKGMVSYKGKIIEGYISQIDPDMPQNATIYAIDLSTRQVKWKFELPNRYHAASVVVSGGVVYAVDRAGILYAIDADTGELIRRISFGGLGAAGVSLGADIRGRIMLFVPTGGGEIGVRTPGLLAAFSLPEGRAPEGGIQTGPESILVIAAALVIAFSAALLVRRRKKSGVTST